MKVIRTDAELRLNEVLKALQNARTDWHAHLYRIGLLGRDSTDELLKSVCLPVFTNHFKDADVFLFCCGDGDAVVLGKNLPSTTCRAIATRLAPAELAENFATPFHLDNETEWTAIRALCEDYIAKTAQHPSPDTPLTLATDPKFETQRKLLEIGFAERDKRKKPCVLLIEDDPMSLHMARKALEGPVTIETAPDAATARNAYMAHIPDIVFLDIDLPDASGHDLLGEFLAIDPKAFVVMLSGNSFPDSIQRSLKLGAKGFIGKPFTRAKLLAYVNQTACGARALASNSLSL